MTPDALLDIHEAKTFPPNRHTPFTNTVIVRNNPSIFRIAREIEEGERESDAVIVLLDACALRHHVRDAVRTLLETTELPVYTAPMGKAVVSEGMARHGGVRFRVSHLFRSWTVVYG